MAKATVWVVNDTGTPLKVTYRKSDLVTFTLKAHSTEVIHVLDYNSAREFKFIKNVGGSITTASKWYYFAVFLEDKFAYNLQTHLIHRCPLTSDTEIKVSTLQFKS